MKVNEVEIWLKIGQRTYLVSIHKSEEIGDSRSTRLSPAAFLDGTRGVYGHGHVHSPRYHNSQRLTVCTKDDSQYER